jgi:acyl dehydratase
MSFVPGASTENEVVAARLTAAQAVEGATSPVYLEGPITRTDIVRYAGAGGDFNPVHHDEEFAKNLGLPSVFAMGLLGAGYLSRLVTDWLGLRNLRFFSVRFATQVWPGDVLQMSGTVTRVYDEAGERRVDVEFAVTNADGGSVIKARATAKVEPDAEGSNTEVPA